MLDELRERIAAYLGEHRVCVLSTAGPEGGRAMPVLYRNRGLEVECLLPNWSDVAYDVRQNPRVTLVVLDAHAPEQRWLQVKGTARLVERPTWSDWLFGGCTASPDELYQAVQVTPCRIDLMDASQGWGARETLDL
jgi:general stress protein 26